MGRGVFRKIIKQPVGTERLEKKGARLSAAELIEQDTKEQLETIRARFAEANAQKRIDTGTGTAEGAVDAENGTATTNAGNPLGTGDNLAMPTAQTDADSGAKKRQEGSDLLPPGVPPDRQSPPDRQGCVNATTSGDSRERPATSSASGQQQGELGRTQESKKVPEIYGDVEVCRLLKIRRRKIAEARTKSTRGVDWDCVGLHAGMTKKWIHETAIKMGIVPDFFNVPLTPLKDGDGVVSCKLLGTWPNRTKVTVEVVATGEVKVATVRDANEFHLYDIFDARDYGREIQWTAELNNVIY